MLNRRILRIKAFKVLYSYSLNSSMSLQEAESQLQISCEAVRDLYLFMLGVISPLAKEASKRIEAAKTKFNPTQEDLNPNRKFADNALAVYFENDPDFKKLTSRKNLSWEQYDAFVSKLYDSILTKDYFKKYMSGETSSIGEDVKLFIKIYEEEFVDNASMDDILEDMSIYWNDDLAYALTICCRSLEKLVKEKSWNLPPLYMSEILKLKDPNVDSDKVFVTKLMRAAFTGFEKYSTMVSESVTKWDRDRLFSTDLVLIALGLAEAKTFSEIPIKVTINEYVEISKYYSTPKSSSFVNGLLDKLIQAMVESGDVVKSGKGLL